MYNIYLISAINEGNLQWKIGLSKHPEKRIKELKTANPNIDKIVGLYEINRRDVAYKTEALIKKKLKPFKINGEWVEGYSLNQTIFFEYCKLYEEIAISLIQIKKNITE